MRNAICIVAAAPLRKEPTHRSEMISQLLFGETCNIIESTQEWIYIKCSYDGYEGWVTDHLIEELVTTPDLSYLAPELFNKILINGITSFIPMGSTLTGYKGNSGQLWKEGYQYNGAVQKINYNSPSIELLEHLITPWLYAPYLWGGRTFMGVDCSGFVQNIFKVMGIILKRDAYLQAEQGIVVSGLQSSKKSDLAFFNNDSGRIIHVGIILDDFKIVHASGRVRIDKLVNEGIMNVETGKLTHKLFCIKSFF